MIGFVKKYRVNSLSSLLLLGFLLAGLPLLWTIGSSIQSVGTLAGLSQQAIYQSTQSTQSSQVLMETLTAMERSLRQYLVLNDDELLDSYYKDRQLFVDTVGKLRTLNLQRELKQLLDQLVKEEESLFVLLAQDTPNKIDSIELVKRFDSLNGKGQQLWTLSVEWVDRQSEQLKSAATQVQKNILRNTSFVLPIFVILVVLFTYLIARPIRQLEQSIIRMSSGDLTQAKEISGPEDIRLLGERLNFLRQKLRKLERDQQKFFQQVSHELKTPLASINEGAGLLIDEVVGQLNGEQLEIVRILQDSSTRLKEQINSLLEYSRLNAEKNSLNIEKIDLRYLVDQVVQHQRILLQSKKIKVKTDVLKVALKVDKQKFEMILDNLLSNAIKYSPQGGRVVFSSSYDKDSLMLAICDEGYGLNEEEEDKIFDLFYQGSVSKKHKIQGSGLGLAIAKDLIEAHGGNIKVDLRYNKGAKFILTLPKYCPV